MARPDLRLLPPWQNVPRPSHRVACRCVGCAALASDQLGFCAPCRLVYDEGTARRWRFVQGVCARLAAGGDPLFAAFSGRSAAFGAHVAGHLEASNADSVHVPAEAIEDYVAEIDEIASRIA